MSLSSGSFDEITQSRQASKEPLLDELSFDGIPLFYDRSSGRWLYSRPANGNTDPVIHIKGAKEGVKIGFPKGAELLPGNEIRFIVYTDPEYALYSLAVTNLPIIRIDVASTEIPETAVPMKFTLFDNESRNIILSNGTIHFRGKSSALLPKKSFRITLYDDHNEGRETTNALLGLRKDGDWILYAPYNLLKIRNVFTSNLWYRSCAARNSFGLMNGMEYRWVELFLNDEYWGLYALGYPIDRKQQQIKIAPDGHYEEYLYKQVRSGPYHNFTTGELIDALLLQYPENDDDEAFGMILREQFFTQVMDPEKVDLYHNDPQNAIDAWLFLKLVQAVDTIIYKGMTNNMMYTIKKGESGFRILYTPWDLDTTWGIQREDFPGNDPYNNQLEMTLNPVSTLLARGDRSVAKMVQNEYADLREHEWADSVIENTLDDIERDVLRSGAFQRDSSRWPGEVLTEPDPGFDDFREFVLQRFHSMDEYIGNL